MPLTWPATRSGFQDFMIAHELLYLRVSNHGRLFKALLTACVPDWKRYDIERHFGRRRITDDV